jgi:tetratricopeptide (TPR) repeat protein
MTEWKIGDRIENRYEIHQILKGGMGVVYICYEHEHRTPYALKTFQDRYLENQQVRDRFIREAETWVRLEKHQNIVRAHWVQNIQDKPYIVLEYIANPEMRGADLGRWIRRGMEISQVLNFAVQFCDGMDYAYKKVGMVHRDIKPGNILVTQDRVVKITDFGLVKTGLAEASGEDFLETAGEEAVSDGVSFTCTGAVMGTPPYMSPEQCRNAAEVDIRSDIYAFGAVLYEMLTGRWVFEATTVATFLRCHLHEDPSSLCSIVPDLPRDLEAVVLRCLAKEPEQRFPDFAELRAELVKIHFALTGEEVGALVEGENLEAWEWANKGISLAALGYKEEAIRCYDRTIEVNPRYANVWYSKGNSLAALGDKEKAIRCYDRALEIDSKYAHAWSNKGIALRALGQIEEAIRCYDRALEIEPKLVQTWYNKGIALSALGQPENAIRCYARSIEINPGYANAWYNKGNSLAALGDKEEAIYCYDRALEFNPKLAQAWSNKGNALSALGQPEEGIHCYDRALELDPRYADAWFNKGAIFVDTGRFQEALDCFTKILKIDPYDEEVKQIIALCQQHLKQG